MRDRAAADKIHLTLDVAGIFDPTPWSDLTNAGLYVSEGNYLAAGISIVGVLPWIGDIFKSTRITAAMARLAERGAVKGGTTVLGHYPQYAHLATEIGARRFNIPTHIWNRMTETERWAANQNFLDRMISRGDNVMLATPINQVKPGSYYQRELNYLFDKGYKVSPNGLYLIK
jgi:hypothetical protein